ncbi:hypothetical protein IF2G_03449 [Cordyceps javanica]|nr:hypothetical protein IF2G_03449 [Cordyceps javanica]
MTERLIAAKNDFSFKRLRRRMKKDQDGPAPQTAIHDHRGKHPLDGSDEIVVENGSRVSRKLEEMKTVAGCLSVR